MIFEVETPAEIMILGSYLLSTGLVTGLGTFIFLLTYGILRGQEFPKWVEEVGAWGLSIGGALFIVGLVASLAGLLGAHF